MHLPPLDPSYAKTNAGRTKYKFIFFYKSTSSPGQYVKTTVIAENFNDAEAKANQVRSNNFDYYNYDVEEIL
jgi:hypothetical protein